MTNTNGLIFLGPPGSGKGTQASLIAQLYKIPHISTGEILREAIANQTPLGKQAQPYMDAGNLVPEELVLGLVKERLSQPDTEKGWILDGFPRTVPQAEFLDKLLEETPLTSERVLNLDVPDEAIIERLLLRGRKDDTEATIRRRLEVYREQTAPLIDYYRDRGKLHFIDGNRSLAEVTEALKQAMVNF
ncbi:MAG: adenylate kinase [Hydrococcus sp. Prado102]|jgi:adenylate kinase|nr:adenylate kinase [Hydrococcus sp. Prado102]